MIFEWRFRESIGEFQIFSFRFGNRRTCGFTESQVVQLETSRPRNRRTHSGYARAPHGETDHEADLPSINPTVSFPLLNFSYPKNHTSVEHV